MVKEGRRCHYVGQGGEPLGLSRVRINEGHKV